MRMLVLAACLTVALYTNSAAQWPRHTIDNQSRGADGVKLADINNDRRLDIVTGWEEGGITRVYLHPGVENCTQAWPAVTVGLTKSVEDAAFADVDGDGTLDVITCCEGGTRTMYVHWGPNQRPDILNNACWNRHILGDSQGRMMWMFAIPVQIDGRNGVDIVAAGKGGDAQIGWWESPADGRKLSEWKWHPMSEVGWVMSIFSEDMDDDGDLDIVTTDRRGENRGCRWLENPGVGNMQAETWKSHTIGAAGREVMFMTIADLDGDGLRDVLVAVKTAEVLLLKRLDGSGKRWKPKTIPYAENMGTAKGIAVGDMDKDGMPDIVISCEHATPPKSGVKWLSCETAPFSGDWQGHDISGSDGIKFDRIELLDVDEDGNLDVLTCEERHEGRGLGVIWYENPHE